MTLIKRLLALFTRRQEEEQQEDLPTEVGKVTRLPPDGTIDTVNDMLLLADGRAFEITQYIDINGAECDPINACAIDCAAGSTKLRVNYFNPIHTLH